MVTSLNILLASLASTTKMTSTSREFRFVDYGQSFPKDDIDDRPTISCDGRIPGGVTLELTHWTGNETPDDLYADTSTEMAMKLLQNKEYSEQLKNAVVLNNHYDTDGVLSVWACLAQPHVVLPYADLLIQGAEAGDFGEWSSDLGVKLDCALSELCEQSSSEKEAFVLALEKVPDLLDNLLSTGGKAYEKLWKPGFDFALECWDALEKEKALLDSFSEDLVILKQPDSISPISPFAIHRGLVQKGLVQTTKRILRVSTVSSDSSSHRYQYEKVGHGWVQKLVQRPLVPTVNEEKLVNQLNALDGQGSWKTGGGCLVSICQTTKSLTKSAHDVALALAKLDDGLQL